MPELVGKRAIEERLAASPMQSVIIRNAGFMDVCLVMGGFKQAADRSAHATTGRDYGFTKLWMSLVGDLVERHGYLLAPGGTRHGTPIIATRDVAEMLVGGVLYPGSENLLIESGGPEWLTWREIADAIERKTGRRVRVLPIPSWLARMNQALVRPFSASAASIFALIGFVADFQPRWSSEDALRTLNLPKQWTVADYLDANYSKEPK